MEWPNELVLDFLTFYEIEAVIWNPALPNHKNRNEVYDAWKRIEEKMEKKFTVTELKKKKDSLMASYRTCLKKVKDTTKSGAGTEDIYKPNWFAYEMMDRFLKDKNVPRETLTSEVTNEIEVQSENEGPPPAPEKVPPSVSCPEEVNEGRDGKFYIRDDGCGLRIEFYHCEQSKATKHRVLSEAEKPRWKLAKRVFLVTKVTRCSAPASPVSGGCPRLWDGLLCWPPTPAATLATLPCFAELNGIKYDTSENASRRCRPDGAWDNYTDYAACLNLRRDDLDQLLAAPGHSGVELATNAYALGYTLSLAALGVAVSLFFYFKELHCLRNTIHTNLMVTYILADAMWIMNMVLQGSIQSQLAACTILFLLHYFYLTSFFWMFVEGLYLYLLVVETFTRETVKLRVYALIGWGTPMVIVPAWAVAKITIPPDESQSLHGGSGGGAVGHCSWMTPHSLDWIYQAPAFTVLALNLLFLVRIMWVLITKLRSANNAETQQYRKASKALVVLIPLLGITYILVIVGPTQGVPAHVYDFVRAILLSTQGFAVALFYCFLNSEVQNTVRHRLERWKESRELAAAGDRRFTLAKDWSPNARNDSIRLCHTLQSTAAHYKKRESTVSETTLMTVVGGGGGSARVSNGSVGPPAALAMRTSISPNMDCAENAV